MIEFVLMAQAYLMLTNAILHGESLSEAGANYFEANCYIEGYTAQDCAYARTQGIIQGIFPVDLSKVVTDER